MPNKNDAKGSQEIALDDTLVRLAQGRAMEYGVKLDNELARMIAEEAVMSLPEDANILLDESASIGQSNVLAYAVGANDLVLNGRQVDVRPVIVSESGACSVSIDRVLVGTPYLAHGSLVVELTAGRTGCGSVVGYITPNAWLKAEAAQKESGGHLISLQNNAAGGDFDLSAAVEQILAIPSFKLPSMTRLSDVKGDLQSLVNDRETLISARQKQIFAYISTNWQEDIDNLLPLVESVPVKLSTAKMQMVLRDSVLWQSRVARIVATLAQRFPTLDRAELEKRVLLAGEKYGSQLTAPRYRRALLAELIALEFSSKSAKSPLQTVFSASRAQALVEKVLAGDSAVEAVKNLIGNKIAVDLAFQIQKQRQNLQKVSGLLAATSEELGFAYGQLALQPAYATHSSTEESGVDSINEALALFAASDLAGEVKGVELDLANI